MKKIINRIVNHICIRNSEYSGSINAKILSAALTNQEAFSEFKNYCNGKSVVVCGAGPTLQKYKPIKEKREIIQWDS